MGSASIRTEIGANGLLIKASGQITQKSLPLVRPRDFSERLPGQKITIDFSEVTELDTSGANALLILLRDLNIDSGDIEIQAIAAQHARVLELVSDRSDLNVKPGSDQSLSVKDLVRSVGQKSGLLLGVLADYVSLVGRFVDSLFRYCLHPKSLRLREIFTQLEQAGLKAIPVILLVNLLIGIVMAYLLAMQAEKFGASIFVVDGVAIAMCREMSPILVAIILAGRSGSAFAAQLGTMKLTEEVDAIKSIGLKPFDVLVFPRIVALLISMPLLVFLGDLVGIFGGMLVTESYLGLTYHSFLVRLEMVLELKHIVVGLVKAPAFALAIGLIACRTGLNAERDARSVGLSTTRTVVQSIVAVILMNAAFTVVFAELGV